MPSCFLCGRSWCAENKHISIHRLPTDEPRRQQWMQFFVDCNADLTKIKPSTVICSEHFKADCFKNYVKVNLLKEDAVPSIVVNRLKYAKIAVPEMKVSHSNTSASASLENIKMEDFGEIPEDNCSEPLDNLPNTNFFLKEPSKKSIEVMVQASVSDSDVSPRKTFLEHSVSSLVDMCKTKDKKLKIQAQRIRRQRKKISSLKSVINTLKAQLLVKQEQADLSNTNFGKHKDLLHNLDNKNTCKKLPKRYSIELCKFAVTLNFYSPKAY